jgi:tRNA (guanine37-N1)-methyltransferase
MASTTEPWRATVLTLFPEMFPGPLGASLAGKALAAGLWALQARDIRDPPPIATAAWMTPRPVWRE